MKLLVLLILVFYAIERIVETFWRWKTVKGAIVAPVTLHLLVGAYIAVYVVTLWEWVDWKVGPLRDWAALVGVILVLISVVGRHWAIRTLGLYHSIHIEIRENHELIQSGPYRVVRNPYYLSNVIEAIGIPLVASAWLAMSISIFLYMPLLILRLVLEERALEEKFKDSFIHYKKQAPRILPKFFCTRGKR